MHLIVIIALGVFGGLWLFVRWLDWREYRYLCRLSNLAHPKPARTLDEKNDRAVAFAVFGGGLAVVVVVSVVAIMSHGQ